jgi:hypothetical protein
MSRIAFIAIIVLCMSAVSVLLLIWRSAEGHEDEEGFHLGSEDDSSDSLDDAMSAAPRGLVSHESVAPIAIKK